MVPTAQPPPVESVDGTLGPGDGNVGTLPVSGSSSSTSSGASASSSSTVTSSSTFSSSSGTEDDSSECCEPASPHDAGEDKSKVPDYIDGSRLTCEDRVAKSGYFRHILECKHHSGERCKKHRNAGPSQTQNFGKFEPIAYLAVWQSLGCSFGSRRDHLSRRLRVPLDLQEKWLRDHGYL